MNDLISRQAAIDELNSLQKYSLIDSNDYLHGTGVRLKFAVQKLEQLPSAQQWIPCSEVTGEGYPKEDGFYYVTERNYGFYLDADSKQNVAHTSHFFNGDFTDRFYDKNHSNIVAWMPLQDPYEEGREEWD